MFTQIVRVQNKGLITIPKSFRDDFGLKKDDLVRLRKFKGRVVIEPVRVLSYAARSYTDKELEKFFQLDDKETKKYTTKGIL